MKLTLRIALLLAVAMAAALLVVELAALSRESALLEGDLRRDARLISQTLAAVASQVEPAAAAELVHEVAGTQSEVEISWLAPGELETAGLPAEGLAALRANRSHEQLCPMASGAPGICAWSAVDGAAGLAGVVKVAEPVAVRDDFVSRGMSTAALTILGVTLLSGLAAVFLGRQLVGRRVDRLVAKTRQVARGDLSQPVVELGDDELGLLGQALNRMSRDLERLQRTAEAEAQARLSAELALQHADRLRTVGVLAAGVAHELGTPLHVITGRAGLIERRATDERVKADARKVRAQVERISRIVRLMMDFSRGSTPQVRPLELDRVAGGAIELLAQKAREAEVGVTLESPEPGPSAVADPEQLAQVLTNLVLNAIHATPAGGRVVVRLGGPERGRVRVSVSDSGPGVPEAERARIFEPFVTTKPPGDGTGLGLSIVARIVKDHGSEIVVSDAQEGGACFSFTLPAEVRP